MRAVIAGALAALVVGAAPAAAVPPDGRAYEQVSPVDKAGYPVGWNQSSWSLGMRVSRDGDRITYTSWYPLPPSDAGPFGAFASDRGEGGWITAGLTGPPGPIQIGNGLPGSDMALRGSTPDGRVSVYWDSTTVPFGSLWVTRADGSRQRIFDAVASPSNAFSGEKSGQAWFMGMSDDGRHVVFASDVRFGPAEGLPGSADILYEWVDDGGSGTLRVVSRTNASSVELIDPGAAAELGGTAAADVFYRVTLKDDGKGMRHAVSRDGTRIFFQTPAPACLVCGGGPLYVRESGETTTEVSAPAAGHAPVSAPTVVKYLDATPDGGIVFFWADGDLAAGAPPVGGIYRYSTVTGALTFVTEAPRVIPDGGTSANRVPTAMASDDGSHLYFERPGGIFLHVGGEDRTVMAGGRAQHGPVTERTFVIGPTLSGLHADGCPSANVSPDGRHFVFSAIEQSALSPVLNVYRYDAAGGGGLTLVSESPGAPAPELGSGFGGAGNCKNGVPLVVDGRVMSDDGAFVFFDTARPLVPHDTNDMWDTYRWRASDGSVDLISSGTSPESSFFAGSDGSGRTAFFTTTEALVPSDGDAARDIYAARIGGGFAEPPAAPDCEGDACQGAPSRSPAPVGVASAAVRGHGDAGRPSRASLSLAKLSSRQRLRLARGRRIAVRVRSTRRGRVSVTARAKLGKRRYVVASGKRTVGRPGSVKVPLRLSSRARVALRRGATLRLRVVARSGGIERTQVVNLRRRK